MQLRDQQRRQIAACAQQKHDITGSQISPLRCQPRAFVDQRLGVICQPFRQLALFIGDPRFFVSTVACGGFIGNRCRGDRCEQLDQPEIPFLAVMILDLVSDPEICATGRRHHRVNEVEHRRGRPKTL